MANSMSQSDIELMRQQAIERVKQMQKQSQNYISQSNISNKNSNGRNQNIHNSSDNNQHNNNNNSSKEPPAVIVNNQNLIKDNPKPEHNNHPFSSRDIKKYFRKMPKQSYRFNNNIQREKSNRKTVSKSLGTISDIIGNSGGMLSGITERVFPSLKGKIDSEILIIVGLIILLAKDGADTKLLIALGYLLI